MASHFVALFARHGNGWRIAEMRDCPAPAGGVTPYERLKELEWMVGEWVDASEGASVRSNVRWGEGKGYLIRDYSVHRGGEPAMSGLMIIAWDPLTDEIKGWVFNADGSRGEGSWIRAADNQWIVEAHGSTASGRPSSEKQIIILVNMDVIRMHTDECIVGGRTVLGIADSIMVRKPPAPRASSAPAGASMSAPPVSAH
jgi:hypothetical protein